MKITAKMVVDEGNLQAIFRSEKEKIVLVEEIKKEYYSSLLSDTQVENLANFFLGCPGKLQKEIYLGIRNTRKIQDFQEENLHKFNNFTFSTGQMIREIMANYFQTIGK